MTMTHALAPLAMNNYIRFLVGQKSIMAAIDNADGEVHFTSSPTSTEGSGIPTIVAGDISAQPMTDELRDLMAMSRQNYQIHDGREFLLELINNSMERIVEDNDFVFGRCHDGCTLSVKKSALLPYFVPALKRESDIFRLNAMQIVTAAVAGYARHVEVNGQHFVLFPSRRGEVMAHKIESASFFNGMLIKAKQIRLLQDFTGDIFLDESAQRKAASALTMVGNALAMKSGTLLLLRDAIVAANHDAHEGLKCEAIEIVGDRDMQF